MLLLAPSYAARSKPRTDMILSLPVDTELVVLKHWPTRSTETHVSCQSINHHPHPLMRTYMNSTANYHLRNPTRASLSLPGVCSYSQDQSPQPVLQWHVLKRHRRLKPSIFLNTGSRQCTESRLSVVIVLGVMLRCLCCL